MGASYWRVAETARHLDAIADEIDSHRQARHRIYPPPQLTDAARRIVAAADWSRSQVVVDRMPVSQAILQVIDVAEVVTAVLVRDRLAQLGRTESVSTITVTLHRMCKRMDLVSTARGRFRLPTAAEEDLAIRARENDEA